MAVDEALALLAPLSGFRPTLRIYRWKCPAVSIGYNQEITRGVDVGFCRAQSIDIVRRPTGGRAVYHHQELTYSVVVPRAFFKGDTVLASYRVLAGGFLEALSVLGISGELLTPALSREGHGYAKKGRRYAGRRYAKEDRLKGGRQPACFLSPSMYEIGVGGRKIIGSAQRRYRYCVLQQGSFLLDIDWERFLRVFSGPEGKQHSAHNQVAGLSEVAGREIGYEEVAGALIAGFEKAFDTKMVEGGLSEKEQDLAKRLEREKYSSNDWNVSRVDRLSAGLGLESSRSEATLYG